MPRFEQVVALGRKLVDELGKEPHVDTLARWMAHYVAELIDAAENGPADQRVASRRKCFDAILELWSYRAELPSGRRPFEDLEPIARALESLDPDNEMPRFYRSVRRAIDKEKESPDTQSILDFVDSIDSIARILVGYALADAVGSAMDESREWVALAKNAGTRAGFADVMNSFVSDGIGGGEQSDRTEPERNRLSDHVERLEVFASVAARVTEELRARLDAMASGDLAGDDGDG